MEFLKKHYEKIVLGALILGFCFALIYLMQVIDSARSVTGNDLKFPNPPPDYEISAFDDKEFNADYRFGEKSSWTQREQVEVIGIPIDGELTASLKAIRCSECNKIVPLETLKTTNRCPLCNATVETPPEVSDNAFGGAGGVDSDGDGMPDLYEAKMGFNSNNYMDASQDADGDGFSNLYEYLMGTDPLNAKSFPGLDKRIYLVRLMQTPLPFELKSVTVSDEKDKSTWEIQVINRRKMQDFWNVGQTIMMNEKEYRVKDAIAKVKQVEELSVVINQDESQVILEAVDGSETLVLVAGKRAYFPEKRAEIEDIATGAKFRKAVGESMRVGDDRVGYAVYQVSAIDTEKERVTLLNQEDGTEVLLTRDVKIPENARVSVGYGNMDGGMMMPGGGYGGATQMPQNMNRQTGR